MNPKPEQIKIEADNKKIEEAVVIAKVMSSQAGKIIKRDLLLMEKDIRFQDILGIKDDALKDQKGIVIGIASVQDYFDSMKRKAEQPRRDPITGKKEVMNKKK